MNNKSDDTEGLKFRIFLQELKKKQQEIVPQGLEDFEMYIITNFNIKDWQVYETAIREHNGGKLYGGAVVLKVLYGHAQAENGAFLDSNEFATLVAYYKPAPHDKSSELYNDMRGMSEELTKIQKKLYEHLKNLGEDVSHLEKYIDAKGFTYDLSSFWDTFDRVKARRSSK